MHLLGIVIVPTSLAANKEEARCVAREKLDEEGCGAEDRLFCSSYFDWYVIGGRFSGELKAISLGFERWRRFVARVGQEGWSNYTEMFEEEYPDITPPKSKRDLYRPDGYDDDIVLLNEELAEYLRNECGCLNEICDIMSSWYWLVDGRELEKQIGAAYAVAVDLHC